MALEWHGAEAMSRTEQALKLGIDKTTSDAAIMAKRLVNVDTATLQGGIHPEPAIINSAGQVEGVYGPHDVAYAVEQEFLLGEQMPDGSTRQRKGGKPYMRPSYESAKKALPENIIAAYRGQS